MRVGLTSDDMIVIRLVVIETYPAYDDGTPIDICIVGHAEPSRESGKPRLMNDKYMIAISNDAINVYSSMINAALSSKRHTDMYFHIKPDWSGFLFIIYKQNFDKII